MTLRLRPLLLLLFPAALAMAASTQVSLDRPIINFSLPTFTPEGYRSWLVRGSEARFVSKDQIDIKELTLSIFTGLADGQIETLILSPNASVRPAEAVITGRDTIRVIRTGHDAFEVTGADWRYEHKEKRVSIARDVRVTFQAELQDFLK
ncbi:MAG: hypothetical protein JNG83_02720 [Opitutaceae bacterium]|nr:hypothetical protein [Opitutaceae bacterium]